MSHQPQSQLSARAHVKSLLLFGFLLTLVGAVIAPACISGGPDDLGEALEGPGGTVAPCTDEDGDGFGLGCPAGQDCDDADPSSTSECYACKNPGPGCPCDSEGVRITCGEVQSKVGDQTVCGTGESVCTDGQWGECIINNATLLPEGNNHSLGLGPPSACTNNPCDPYCNTFNDTPGGLGNPGGGTVVTDAGISVPLGEGGVASDAGGYICSGGSATGTCAHSICATGTKLTPGCDSVALPWQGDYVPSTRFSETFDNNSQGWSLGPEWTIKSATASAAGGGYNGDPGTDHTPTGANGVAGVVIPGNATTAVHGAYYLTSPTINTAPAGGTTATLEFWRWLNSDLAPYMVNTVEVSTNNGSTWAVLWQTASQYKDNSWQYQAIDVTAYKSTQFKVRFGVSTNRTSYNCNCDQWGCDTCYYYADPVSSWNLDDVTVTVQVPAPPPSPPPSCVQQICALPGMASCCTGSWTGACVEKIATTCNQECAVNDKDECVLCYKDAYDHDGDGYSYNQGDLRDCDPSVNPGAYDFPGNGIDEDCDGTPDNAVGTYNAGTPGQPVWQTRCDTTLALTSSNAFDHAKAIDLCQTTTLNATGPARKWGVIEASLVQADGTSAPNAYSYGILGNFGSGNVPQGGAKMAVYSSGTARDKSGPNYVLPNGNGGSYNHGTACATPAGFPKNGSCPVGTATANDSSGLRLKVRTPTNAKSFSYMFNFFSSEYSQWICDSFNDSFVALLYNGVYNNPVNSKNISFDASNNPVNVNIGFFTVPGGPGIFSHPKLTNTGFDGKCSAYTCGGATDWLQTTAPIVSGEDLVIHFSIWDQGDHVWDSTVLIDNWEWSPNPATIKTGKPAIPPPPPPPTYSEGWFTRDYDMSNVCPQGHSVSWGLWSWTATTPGDTKIEFQVQTADTAAGLAAAPKDNLQFSNPPGPAALAGTWAIAKTTPAPNTEGGSAVVDATLKALNRSTVKPFLRVTSHLVPSTDKLSAPTLKSWNLQADCVPTQ
jgi:hypothetical protein